MLDWSFSFIRSSLEKKPEIDHICSFRDGNALFSADSQHLPEVIQQMDSMITLINYIAYFPNKDFTKIKLRTSSNQFVIHFLDKRYLDSNFLGVLSVSEVDEFVPFETWGVEDLMGEFIFENYREMLKASKETEFNFKDFEMWLAPEIKEFYSDWEEAKKSIIFTSKFNPFEKEKPKEDKKEPATETVAVPISDAISENTTEIETESATDKKKFEQWWDLQIINEYGQPQTDLISFIDDKAFVIDSDYDKIDQNLESMSISALKILIDTQGGWNINYMKNRLKNEMGFQYTFFEKFNVEDVKYLIIMNSAIFDFETDKCLQAFRGFEFQLLEEIASKICHLTFFTNQGQLNPDNKALTQRIILNCVEKLR
ncbi:MAG: hypothetical protein ACTSVZ_10545 [Promethearchaeota archaeon]